MSEQAWYEQFKDKLQGLSHDSSSGESLLAHALKENALSSEEYLHWACRHYELPLLKQDFFNQTPFSQEFYQKWATQYAWSAECFPVAEWDGTLIVACIEPPQDFPQQLIPATFVLAAYQDIQIYFENINSEKGFAPEGLDLSIPTKAPSLEFSIENLFPGQTEKEEEATVATPELPLSEIPDGILEATQAGQEVILSPKIEIQAEEPVAELESFVAPVASEKSEKRLPPPPPPDAIQLRVVEDDTEEEPFITPVEAIRIPESHSSVKKEPSKIVATVPEDTISQVIELKGKKETHFEDVAITYNNSAASAKFPFERLKKKNGTAFVQKIEQAFTNMKENYHQVMVIGVDEEQTKALPLAWEQSFTSVKDINNSVPLNVPSIFNIVASTQKSFHGYISINEVNEKFFEDWNKGTIPDHVTISPILEGEKLIAMLMGMGEKSSYTRNHLNLTEKLCADLLVDIKAA